MWMNKKRNYKNLPKTFASFGSRAENGIGRWSLPAHERSEYGLCTPIKKAPPTILPIKFIQNHDPSFLFYTFFTKKSIHIIVTRLSSQVLHRWYLPKQYISSSKHLLHSAPPHFSWPSTSKTFALLPPLIFISIESNQAPPKHLLHCHPSFLFQ